MPASTPSNVPENAKPSEKSVIARWGVHEGTAYRWLREAGADASRARKSRPVPMDWTEVCARLHTLAAATHYGVSRNMVARWVRVSGVSPLVGKSGGPRRDQRKAKATPIPKPKTASTFGHLSSMSIVRHYARVADATPIARVEGCMECKPTIPCRAHTVQQLHSDVEAWLAAGNRPTEVPVGVSGQRIGA